MPMRIEHVKLKHSCAWVSVLASMLSHIAVRAIASDATRALTCH
jgi:hypothetical protein